MTIPVVVPAEAFLDDLAADYVTNLTIGVQGVDGEGRVVWQELAPLAFLAWPGGRGTTAELWDAAILAQRAPRGVISEALRASLPEGSARVLAPIPHTTPPPVEILVDGE